MSGGSIEIRDMVARRGSFSLRVDELHIEPHEIFAIVGETGAGKTVLLEAIAGAFPLEAGSILLDGKDIRCLPVQQRRLGDRVSGPRAVPTYDGCGEHRLRPEDGALQAVCPADELFTREFCPQVMAFLGRG